MSADLPDGYSIVNELLGYVERYEFEAGEQIAVHAAGPAGPVTVDVVRLRTFDTRVEVEGEGQNPSPRSRRWLLTYNLNRWNLVPF